jgi:hypothetical protein
VGPETITFRQLLIDLRRWLGYAPAPILEFPLPLIKYVARLGDIVGGPVNTTALRQLEFGNAGKPSTFIEAVGVKPRTWGTALLARPSQAQDRWHARMYFLRPLLRWGLAIMWLMSGLIGLAQLPAVAKAPLAALGIFGFAADAVIWVSCAVDILIGVALLIRWRPDWICALQLLVVISYTIGLSIAEPSLWLNPFGPLLKNVPIIAAILALAAIEPDR